MRVLGIDFGFARIGVAVAETEPEAISPRPAFPASGTLRRDAEAIAERARKEAADRVVIGLPVEPDGEEGRMARICRQLAGLCEELGLQVALVDETLTSVAAEATLRERDLKASQRRKVRDSAAACLILDRYLHEIARP